VAKAPYHLTIQTQANRYASLVGAETVAQVLAGMERSGRSFEVRRLAERAMYQIAVTEGAQLIGWVQI
jgi:hypothetical protein